jgi:hypothetical protein
MNLTSSGILVGSRYDGTANESFNLIDRGDGTKSIRNRYFWSDK